jgi:acetoacetate decarboxylase
MGICAVREVFGYTKKDANYKFDEAADGSISGWVKRRIFRSPISVLFLTRRPVRIVDRPEQPAGIHVRRPPHPSG